jgi:hypothetical protein
MSSILHTRIDHIVAFVKLVGQPNMPNAFLFQDNLYLVHLFKFGKDESYPNELIIAD